MCSVAQLYVTLCDSMDCSPPGSSVNEIFQARTLEWVAISYSRGSSRRRDLTQVSCIAGIFFTNWATGEALESQHAQWLSVMQLVDATPLSSQKLWKLDGITAFLASSTSLFQLHFSLLRVKANASFSQRIRAVALFSSQCKNQVWPLLLLQQEERIRTWENHYKKQQLLSSILLYTHMDTSVLSSSSISLNWGKKKKRKDRIYKWDAGKFCWGHIQLGNRAETELKLKGEVEKRGVNNRIPAG